MSKDKEIWSYFGEYGPDKWHELYPVACNGERQSPVALAGATRRSLSPLTLDFKPGFFKTVRDLYTLSVFPEGARSEASLLIDGTRSKLDHIHFHTPAEHTVSADFYPMEMHFVFVSPEGGMTVQGVFIKEGEANSDLEALWHDIPAETGGEKSGLKLDINKILPNERGYYSYGGSLTMPPCTEGVNWLILKDQVSVSIEALKGYKAVFPPNTRAVCPLNGREVFVSA